MTSPCGGTGLSVVRGGAGRAMGRRDAGTRPAPWGHGVAVRAGERAKTESPVAHRPPALGDGLVQVTGVVLVFFAGGVVDGVRTWGTAAECGLGGVPTTGSSLFSGFYFLDRAIILI